MTHTFMSRQRKFFYGLIILLLGAVFSACTAEKRNPDGSAVQFDSTMKSDSAKAGPVPVADDTLRDKALDSLPRLPHG